MQVVAECAAVLCFVPAALGAGTYKSFCVLSLFPKTLTHQSPLGMKALLGTFEIQREPHSWLYQLKRRRGMIYKKGPVRSELMNLCCFGVRFLGRRSRPQALQALVTEQLNCKPYLEPWAGTAPCRGLMETPRASPF